MKPYVLIAPLIALVSCTGSFEGNPQLSLVIPVRLPAQGSASFTLNCNGAQQSFTAPGLLRASTDALEGKPTGACSLQATPTQPYDILGNANGSAVFVSFPAAGTVQRLTPTLTAAPGFTLVTVAGLCPTRLALSPDETKLAVLDDPADQNSGCANTAPRPTRVAVFNAATGALLPDGLLSVATPEVRQNGQVAFALNNTDLIVLEPFSGSYVLERYSLSVLGNVPGRSDPLTGVFASSGTPVDVGRTGVGFSVAIGGFNGKTVSVILPDASGSRAVQFGPEVNAVERVDQLLPIGSANRVVNNRIQDNSLTAYLLPGSILFKRDAAASNPKQIDAARFSITATDLVFPPDGFAWALTSGSLQKMDTFNFPTVQSVSSVGLGGANAVALAWVIETTP
jgi:hypothetical protein